MLVEHAARPAEARTELETARTEDRGQVCSIQSELKLATLNVAAKKDNTEGGRAMLDWIVSPAEADTTRSARTTLEAPVEALACIRTAEPMCGGCVCRGHGISGDKIGNTIKHTHTHTQFEVGHGQDGPGPAYCMALSIINIF